MASRTIKTYLSLHLQSWSTDLFCRKNGLSPCKSSVVLTSPVAGIEVVQRFSPHLAEHGIHSGCSLSLAQALFPKLIHAPFDPKGDFRSLYKLGLRATRFTPLVAIDNRLLEMYRKERLRIASSKVYGLILDLTGTERLHRKNGVRAELCVARELYNRLFQAGITARIGCAPTIGAAWAVAVSSPAESPFTQIQNRTELRTTLRDYPLEVLRIPIHTVQSLRELGIQTVGEVLALPRKELFARFGALLLTRIDQLTGDVEEPFCTVHTSAPLSVQKNFEVPLEKQQQVHETLLQLFEELFTKLAQKHQRAGMFHIQLFGTDINYRSFSYSKEIALHAATKDKTQISSVLYPVVESLKIPNGIHSILLSAHIRQRHLPEQIHSEEHVDHLSTETLKSSSAELLNNFVAQLGRKNVRRIMFHDSHIPEKSFSFEPIHRELKPQKNPQKMTQRQPSFFYPSYFFRHPQKIKALALLPDKPPVRMNWQGYEYKLISGYGPERISPEWWESFLSGGGGNEREYFTVQDHTGRWLWLFRYRETQEWFVQGIWS